MSNFKDVNHFDLIVIGAGPGGEKAAAKAAYFGKKVAIIEVQAQPGGAGVHTGTLPSKTLKETALYLSGRMEKGLYGIERRFDKNLSIEDFFYRKNQVTSSEVSAINANLVAHRLNVYHGHAAFEDAHHVRISRGLEPSTGDEIIAGDFILIATGSYPFHPPVIPFDGRRVHDSDTILGLSRFPQSLAIVGAGVIGCEYTTVFATMGTRVHLIEGRPNILPFLDHELSNDLVRQMGASGVELLFERSITAVSVPDDDSQAIRITLDQGPALEVDMLLYAAGRSGRTAGLGCEKAGVKLGAREVVAVNEEYQSSVPHIYAVGDVIGFPALASTSMDQGRVAVNHMFHTDKTERLAALFPYGIYTVPEVSMVGLTEEAAQSKGLNYGVGRAHHKNVARGKIMGASEGFLKLVFDAQSQEILGVHIIGSLASEIIHYGVSLVENHRTLDDLITAVFNYPSLHELYKYAAYDGLGNLRGVKLKEA